MRLLSMTIDGSFSLTTFYDGYIPPYAILPHTWGRDEDEVTFQDLVSHPISAWNHKPGYRNLHFCARQATRDGLRFFWVDTCCINKNNDPELTESINSMFRWYEGARICYVYLSDVPSISDSQSSRWFTRGWTLQELLAPDTVRFFNAYGVYYGNKLNLCGAISSITGIPDTAVCGQPLKSLSVKQRLSWAQHREMKRKEDAAYSMLGIFDVSMPLIYGEGRERAFHRLLKEVESLDYAQSLAVKYSQYLPSDKPPKLGTAIRHAEESPASMKPSEQCHHDQPMPRDQIIWDSNLQIWTKVK